MGCPGASRPDKHPSENNDTADLWLKNLERQRARCAYQGDRPCSCSENCCGPAHCRPWWR
ncbi:hypothetical protein CFB43_20610 [Burkholderia sp. AU15512]|nr:hypothetical protein CFB43_20610 [Burkholderia sp. AU15512]